MYKLIYNFYNSIYNWDELSEQLLDKVKPDIIVIVHVQNSLHLWWQVLDEEI